MHASAEWSGSLTGGSGKISAKRGQLEASYSLKSRLGEEPQTNPEELLGAAHAACFSMMVSALASNAGLTPASIRTDAAVTFGPVDGGFAITGIVLTCEADIPGIDAAGFAELAENAKNSCPVSKALGGTPITLTASLVA